MALKKVFYITCHSKPSTKERHSNGKVVEDEVDEEGTSDEDLVDDDHFEDDSCTDCTTRYHPHGVGGGGFFVNHFIHFVDSLEY